MSKATVTAKSLLTQLRKNKKESKYVFAYGRKYLIKPLYDWARTLDHDENIKFSYTSTEFIRLEAGRSVAIFKDDLSP